MSYRSTSNNGLYTSNRPKLLPQIDSEAQEPTPCRPTGEFGLPQQQPLSTFPVFAWNSNQWFSATSTPYSQWPIEPIAATRPDQAFNDGFTALVSAPLDSNWSFDDAFTDADPSVMPAQAETAFNLDKDTQFEAPAAASASATDAAFVAQEDTLTCPQGCPATFSRPVDYRRHMLSHAPHKFKCIFSGCDKTFPRMDKLNDHFRQGHRSDGPVKVSRAAVRTSPKKAAGEKRARR